MRKKKKQNDFPLRPARELLEELPRLRPGELENWNAKAQTLLTFAGIASMNYNSVREFEK